MTPDADPILCASCDCPDPEDDLVATPMGALCRDCAARLQEEIR
jgi:hypothetical protein